MVRSFKVNIRILSFFLIVLCSCIAGDIPVGRRCEGFWGTICGAEDWIWDVNLRVITGGRAAHSALHHRGYVQYLLYKSALIIIIDKYKSKSSEPARLKQYHMGSKDIFDTYDHVGWWMDDLCIYEEIELSGYFLGQLLVCMRLDKRSL